MSVFLICIHHFEAASPYLLHQFMSEQHLGRLYGAVPVELPSLEVADKLRSKARWNTFEKFGFAFPEQIHEDEDYNIYLFSPFFKRQKTPFEKWNEYVYRGVEGFDDFYTQVEDGWEFQDAEITVMSQDEADDQWGCVEVANARRDYEKWKKSVDAQLEKTEDHSFYFLRECEEIAAFIPPPNLETSPDSEQADTLSAKERKEKAMKDITAKILLYARAVEIIVATFKKTGKNFRYTDLARQLEEEGWETGGSNRLNKDLGEQKDIRSLYNMIKSRPPTTDTEKYERWEQRFDEQAKLYYECLIRGNNEGLDMSDMLSVKKKSLMEKR